MRRPTENFMVAMIMILILAAGTYLFLAIRFWVHAQATEIRDRVAMIDLPTECAPYYGDGTHAWKDCMGVGLR